MYERTRGTVGGGSAETGLTATISIARRPAGPGGIIPRELPRDMRRGFGGAHFFSRGRSHPVDADAHDLVVAADGQE